MHPSATPLLFQTKCGGYSGDLPEERSLSLDRGTPRPLAGAAPSPSLYSRSPQAVAQYQAAAHSELGHARGRRAREAPFSGVAGTRTCVKLHKWSFKHACKSPPLTKTELRAHAPATHTKPFPLPRQSTKTERLGTTALQDCLETILKWGEGCHRNRRPWFKRKTPSPSRLPPASHFFCSSECPPPARPSFLLQGPRPIQGFEDRDG